MIKNLALLGLAPVFALAACGGHDNSNVATPDNMTGIDMPDNGGMAVDGVDGVDNGMAASMPAGQQFADMVAASDQYEIEAGKLAAQKAESKALKDFGKMMVEHHGQSTVKLKAAAAKATPAITPNPALTPEQESNLTALRSASGAAFDAAYKTQQVAAHEKALALVQGYAAGGDTDALKTFAAGAQTVVQAHLNKIKAL